MSNLSYWQRRQVEDMYHYMSEAEDAADQIANLYLKAFRYLSLQADEIFEKYQTKHGISEAEARALLNTLQDKTSLDELLQKLKNGDKTESKQELLKKLEAPVYQARLERLRQLQNQLDYVMTNIYQQEKKFSTSFYVDLANEAYYRNIFNLQQRTEAAFSFSYIDSKQIDQVVGSRWSGKNYSERIWSNTQALAQTVKEELLINLVTGRTNREAAEIIANKFGQGSSNARCLVRTESNFVSTEISFKVYKEYGIKEYQYLATLDLRTSKICRELDGKIFLVSECQEGKNCPPMHPWCRSTTISVVDRELIDKMQGFAIDPATGKRIEVPRSMTYAQWYDKYVRGKPEVELTEKKLKNRAADQTQHQKYRKILGREIPEKLDDFQNMKYNEPEKWNSLKLSFRRKNNQNTAFKDLQEPMQKNHINKVLSDMGIDYGEAKIKIVRDPELIGRGFLGWTNPNGKEVQLYPDAFASREELVKTLGHERIHLEQLKIFGPARNDSEAIYYEQGPRFSEDYWWDEYRRRSNYDGR